MLPVALLSFGYSCICSYALESEVFVCFFVCELFVTSVVCLYACRSPAKVKKHAKPTFKFTKKDKPFKIKDKVICQF